MAEGTCSVAKCDKPVFGRGWCQTHYRRWLNHGDVRAADPIIASPKVPLIERFRAKVDFEGPVPAHNPSLGDCHLWLVSCTNNGYGQFRWGGQMGLAHRFIYTHEISPIPVGMQLDHLCRVRNCVRASHLDPVTNRENHERSVPFLVIKTHCPQGHPYSGDNLYIYTKFYRNRICKECRRSRGKNAA